MKVALDGKDKESVRELEEELKKLGVEVSSEPDIVLSVGGDGSFLIAERKFPGVPKLAIRDEESFCRVCGVSSLQEALNKLLQGKYTMKEYPKIEAVCGEKRLIASNEVAVRNKDVYHAVRFDVKAGGSTHDNLIGDGIVFATAFGSTGYFYSITKKSFESGFGLAFNNLTTEKNCIMLQEPDIEMYIKRNTAQVSADNNPDIIEVNDDDIIKFRRANEVLRVICMRN